MNIAVDKSSHDMVVFVDSQLLSSQRLTEANSTRL